MNWSEKYVGIPFREKGRDETGCDCWGLVRLILSNEACAILPSYSEGYVDVQERAEICDLISGAKGLPTWTRVDDPMPLDVAVFRRGHHDTHVGVIVTPRLVLHMDGQDCAKIADFQTGRLKNQLSGFFRYNG